MSFQRTRMLVPIALSTLLACGGHSHSVGNFDELKTRAVKLGCTSNVEHGHERLFGADFFCSKYIGPCACHLTISAMRAEKDQGIGQAQVILWDCPAGTGLDSAFDLLDPILPAGQRDAFHELLTARPKADDPRHSATLVGRNLGPVGIGVTWVPGLFNVGSPSKVVDTGEDELNIVVVPADGRADTTETKPVIPSDGVPACVDGSKHTWERS